jgi:hypothetical protein
MLALRCQDGTERLLCAPPQQSPPSGSASCRNPNPNWAAAQCNENGGFDTVLPYYSGCYPKSVSFWEQYAPDAGITTTTTSSSSGSSSSTTTTTDDICDVSNNYNVSVPPLTPANMGFEDIELGIAEWNKIANEGDFVVRQKCDNLARCTQRDSCVAYEGTCYTIITGGGTRYGVTEPNTLSRNDFRIPEVDASGICASDDDDDEVNFCFSFAMRFNALDYVSEGMDDRFQVKIQVNDDGPVLYERLISIADVGDRGDSGWFVEQFPLPHADLGDATFFEFQASGTNVGDGGLDSVGFIDDIKIERCTPPSP